MLDYNIIKKMVPETFTKFLVTSDGSDSRVPRKGSIYLKKVTGSVYYAKKKNARYIHILRPNMTQAMDTLVTPPEADEVSPEEQLVKNAKRVLRALHANAWPNIRKNLEGFLAGEEELKSGNQEMLIGLKLVNPVTKMYPKKSYREESRTYLNIKLTEAFEDMKDYRDYRNADGRTGGRDFSLSTKTCDDGIFRAWFSSEYRGCGNGDYYLLLNPKTAIFYEKD